MSVGVRAAQLDSVHMGSAGQPYSACHAAAGEVSFSTHQRHQPLRAPKDVLWGEGGGGRGSGKGCVPFVRVRWVGGREGGSGNEGQGWDWGRRVAEETDGTGQGEKAKVVGTSEACRPCATWPQPQLPWAGGRLCKAVRLVLGRAGSRRTRSTPTRKGLQRVGGAPHMVE